MGKHIASFTVSSILQTLSNNDYLNILSYNNTVKFVVPCFENRLVQATRENIDVFMDAIVKLQPDEKSNLVRALEEAFKLLANVGLFVFCRDYYVAYVDGFVYSIEKKGVVQETQRLLAIRLLC